MSVTVAVAYWRDEGFYPRAARSDERGDGYLHNTATMAASWRRISSAADASIVLCTNQRPTGAVTRQFEELGVECWAVPFTSVPPQGYFERFSATFYSLDVLRAFTERMSPSDVLVLVDPDVVWVRDPAPLLEQARDAGLLVKEIRYPPDQRDVGLTRVELTELLREMTGREPDGLARAIGGELVVATRDELARFVEVCDAGFAASLERFAAGRAPWLHIEEHVFAYAFHALGYGDGNTTDAIRRIWTRPGRRRNVRGDELDVLAWHVLTEKPWGLWDVFDDLVARSGPFASGLDDDAYRDRLARRLSIITSPRTRVRLAAGRAKDRVLGRPFGPMPG